MMLNSLDWNTILFAARWGIIALFYMVLLFLLTGVYRETALRLGKKPDKAARMPNPQGRLRVIQAGSDARLLPGTIVSLKPITNIGTAPDNDIILGDMFVSGHHFRMRWDGAHWWLEDLNSKNGTLINRLPTAPGRPISIVRGAMISAGDMVMELID